VAFPRSENSDAKENDLMRKLTISLLLAALSLLTWSAGAFAQTTIFTQAPAGNNSGNAGDEFIQEVTLTGNSQGQISVTFASGTTTGLSVINAYVCVAASAGSVNCIDTPAQIKCSGSATCAASGANATIASDFATYATTGTDFLVCFDIPGVGNDDTPNVTGVTGANINFNSTSGRCSSQSRSTGFSQVSGDVWGVSQITTKSAAAAGPPHSHTDGRGWLVG
jgi:hypothetical protein